MKYPQALLLPLLMFADYFLTVLGAIHREKKYARHFTMEHYELNPKWQTAISQKKWWNPRHAFLVVVGTGGIIGVLQFGDMPVIFDQVLLGTLLATFAMLVGRHISNLLIFRYLEKHAEQISGQITMAHPLVLAMSMYQTAMVLIPMALVAVLSHNNYAYGGVLGCVLLVATHWGWIRKATRRKMSQQSDSPGATL